MKKNGNPTGSARHGPCGGSGEAREWPPPLDVVTIEGEKSNAGEEIMKKIKSTAMRIAIIALTICAPHGALLAQSTSGPFDGRWSATVPPQGTCNFTSILILDVVGSSIVGNATNPLGVFPLSGTVNPSGTGVFKIGAFVGTFRFSGTKFEANYANQCGGRFAIGTKQAAGN